MAGYFSVKGFKKFQHYKDRKPPWIKLYNDLLDDYEFGLLPDASKMHLLAIWLLASRYSNRIPHDAEWISRRISATESVDLKVLEQAGFIILDQDCSKPLADCKQSACLETERETEIEIEETNAIALAKKPPEALERPNCLDRTTDGKRGKRLAEDWRPHEEDREFAFDLALNPERIAEQFRDHWTAAVGKGATARDWHAKWRTWCRNEAKWAAERMANRPKSTGVVANAVAELAEIEGQV